jgi:hypothetical protein
MKVNITLDGTPDEVRAFFGWPPLATLQEEWLQKMREQMAAGADPSVLFKGMMPGAMPNTMSPEQLQNVFAMQQAFWQQLNPGNKSGTP